MELRHVVQRACVAAPGSAFALAGGVDRAVVVDDGLGWMVARGQC